MTPRPAVVAALVLLSAAATAQRTPATPGRPGGDERRPHRETRWDEQRSWTLFAACDRNGDDRIDVLEASACELVDGATRDIAGFRRLDADATGFIEYPEFDRRYRDVIERAGTFTVMVSAPIEFAPNPIASDGSDDPTLLVLRTADQDRSGTLSAEEFTRCLADNGEDPSLAAQFGELDRDGSGGLDATELGPFLQFMTHIWDRSPEEEARRRSLPEDDRAADTDGDGLLDREELEASLRLLSPSLARWSDRGFSDADDNGSKTLGGEELMRHRRAARQSLSTR